MSNGHPEGLPELFLDRNLGRRQVPELLRAHGLLVHPLAEVYGIPADEEIEDETWLERAGTEGWTVLMKDERIRYRPAERAALVSHRVQAFCLTNGNLRASAMARQYIDVIDQMAEACRSPGPFLFAVSGVGLRPIDLA